MSQMDPATATWLTGPDGRRALAQAGSLPAGTDPVARAQAWRRARPDLSAPQAAAVAEQVELRELAGRRYGIEAGRLLLTREGLEQATRPALAAARAALVAASGCRRVVDLTAGLGFDAAAFAAAGMTVTAVERDPGVATLCAANWPGVEVIVGDAEDVATGLVRPLRPLDVVFVDPARRGGVSDAHGRSRSERDPERWSPPWSFVTSLPHARVVAKVAATTDPPSGWHAMWTSIDHTVIDATLFSWPVFAEPARALILGSHGSAWIAADATPPPEAADTIGPAMVEIDPAVIRAGAAATLAARVPGLHPVGLRSSWWTGPAADLLPLARTFPIVAELTGPPRTQRRLLDEHGVDALAVKSRDTGEAPATILRELGRRPGTRDVLVVTRRNDRVVRYLCRRSR